MAGCDAGDDNGPMKQLNHIVCVQGAPKLNETKHLDVQRQHRNANRDAALLPGLHHPTMIAGNQLFFRLIRRKRREGVTTFGVGRVTPCAPLLQPQTTARTE